MGRHAVCYTATSGYLFPTVLSALQARRQTARPTEVFVCFFALQKTEEESRLREICETGGVKFISASLELLGGLHPKYARLFLDQLLPQSVTEVLYLDGDTQVVGDINALMCAEPPEGSVLAVCDPMVFIREINLSLRRKIDTWWDQSAIPPHVRRKYVNSGVLRVSRSDLRSLCSDVLACLSSRATTFRFPDQDAINLCLNGQVQTVSMSWNFPGFLLNTQFVDMTPPKIVHFMSRPRPWNAPLPPWGNEYYEPYQALVRDNQIIEPYWTRFTGREKFKYTLQQRYKAYAERRSWQTPEAAEIVVSLEHECRDLAHA